jgi:DNA-binding response OmpR family regulator
MKLTALIVEDDTTLQTIYRFILQRHGFDVHFAQDGRVAIQLLQKITPQLLFLDMLLPYVQGLDVLRFVRSETRFSATRVIVTSSIEHFEREMEHEEFLLKPIHAPALARIAEETHARFAGNNH